MRTTDVRPGKRYRVTLVKGMEYVDAAARAGTVYAGIAHAVEAGACFDLHLDNGSVLGFYMRNRDILIEELERTP